MPGGGDDAMLADPCCTCSQMVKFDALLSHMEVDNLCRNYAKFPRCAEGEQR
jgi:hypothetical protein